MYIAQNNLLLSLPCKIRSFDWFRIHRIYWLRCIFRARWKSDNDWTSMHWSKHQRQLPVIGHQPLTLIAASGLLLVLTRSDLDGDQPARCKEIQMNWPLVMIRSSASSMNRRLQPWLLWKWGWGGLSWRHCCRCPCWRAGTICTEAHYQAPRDPL